MDHAANAPSSFEELDPLLERAYALDGEARAAFVEQLSEPLRAQIEQLLALGSALTLNRIADDARAALDGLAASEAAEGLLPKPPLMAGAWRLHHELGSGGMGQVFFATREAPGGGDSATGRDFVQQAAIKVLWSQGPSHEVRGRFLRERRLLASLSHPGLARFVDGGFLDDGRPWFAMEYVAGRGIIEHARGRSLQERLRLFTEVCASVAYAHQRLIVHRDIKPANLLVDDAGRARLLDFGIARVLEGIDDGVHTRSCGGLLTLQYASPEQLRGGMVTASSDIYQLGLLLYELIADVLPYDLTGASLLRAVEVICRQMPSRPSSHRRDIDRDLDAIVMTALAKDPDARYRSVTDLCDDVARYMSGLPVRAVPHTAWYLTRRFMRRNALLATTLTASAIGLSAATVVSIRMANEATAQAARSQATQRILSDVFANAHPFEGKGASVTLAEALVRAKPQIQARVAGDPLLAWEVSHTLANIYESLGLVEEEREALAVLLEAADRLGGHEGDHRHLVGIAGMGNVLARTNPVEAVRYFDAHLVARPASKDALDPWLDAQYAYAGALERVREYGRADTATFALAKVMEEHGVADPRKRGRLSQLLAASAQRAGDDAAEDRHREDAVEHMRAANNPSALAVILSNHAIHLGRRGRFEESEATFRQALSIFEDANLRDGTFATILRSYAGLLFRTSRIDEAIETTEKALALLPAGSQHYARFVTELNLAEYSFVAGDAGKALDVLAEALPRAFDAFRDDPSVPRRMLRVFSKVLVFAGATDLARTALGREDIHAALDHLEASNEKGRREAIWAGLARLDEQGSRELVRKDLEVFVETYEASAPLFFDALDRWRVLERLRGVSAESKAALPPSLELAHRTLKEDRDALAQRIASSPVLAEISRALGASGHAAQTQP